MKLRINYDVMVCRGQWISVMTSKSWRHIKMVGCECLQLM